MKKITLIVAALLLTVAGFLQTTKPSRMEEGKKVYESACQACHQPGGVGVPGAFPPLTKNDWVEGDKKRLINVILKGLNDPIKVNGEEYTMPMPAQPNLTDVQIADVLTYIRASFGNKASAISAAEVKALRQ
ncbi:MAG TPA: cytochrome c [Phnomibacter sp.]|nr:cytochrome c [Phnomibacter sp.]